MRPPPHGPPDALHVDAPTPSRGSVGYHVVVPAWSDGDGDGVGDLAGMVDHLGYLDLLGMGAVLLDRSFFAGPAARNGHTRALLTAGPDPTTASVTAAARAARLQLATVPDRVCALADAPFRADALRAVLETELAEADEPVWSLSDPTARRAASSWSDPDPGAGTDATRAGLLIVLALPGTVSLLYGDELGLVESDSAAATLVTAVTPYGRPEVLPPMPWEAGDPGTSPVGADQAQLDPRDEAVGTVAAQLEDPESTLNLLRRALELRTTRDELPPADIEWYGAPADCFAFRGLIGPRGTDRGISCVVNTGGRPVGLPPGRLLLSSRDLIDGLLPARSAAWLLPATS